jgi:hypothetical protein
MFMGFEVFGVFGVFGVGVVFVTLGFGGCLSVGFQRVVVMWGYDLSGAGVGDYFGNKGQLGELSCFSQKLRGRRLPNRSGGDKWLA